MVRGIGKNGVRVYGKVFWVSGVYGYDGYEVYGYDGFRVYGYDGYEVLLVRMVMRFMGMMG